MPLIDTHCHLGHQRLIRQVAEVLQRARAVDVSAVICAAADLEESRQARALARKFDQVWFTAGVHPHEAKDAGGDYLQELSQLTEDGRNVAVGEIGLDYHYDFTPRDVQRRVFAEQLALAGRLNKRVVVHTREAFADTLAILADSPIRGQDVVFHSCTEGPEAMARIMEFGASVGFSGIVTFKKAEELRQAARLVPMDRLLVETDSPFLSPEPVRSMKTNEPANVVHVVRCLAELRGITLNELAEQTTANAQRIFGLGA